jgi:hypothetical protein
VLWEEFIKDTFSKTNIRCWQDLLHGSDGHDA